MGELITIDDSNYTEHAWHQGDDGLIRSKGLIPRNWKTHPQGCLAVAPAFDLKLIDESEWPAHRLAVPHQHVHELRGGAFRFVLCPHRCRR